MARSPHRLPGRGAKLLAVLCSALLACTTVRTRVSAVAPEVTLREGHAVVQLDLWIESDRPLTVDEELRYRAQARRALEQALAGRTQAEGSGALVVRSLGVSRTSARRGDQAAAAVGMAVGVVVVIAVVVILALSDGDGGGKPASTKARPPGFPGSAAPRVRAPRSPAVRPPRFARAPAPRGGARPRVPAPGAERFPEVHRGPAVDVGVGVEWFVPLGPEPTPLPPPPPAAPPAPMDGEAATQEDDARAAERSAEPEPVAPAPAPIPLAPPEPLPVEDRGFFDGDRLVLDAVMVDPASGEVLWRKRVARTADPRNPKAVRAVVDALLSEEGWTAAAPPGS